MWALKKNESRGAKSSTSRPALDRLLDVGEAVLERERELLLRGRAGLADVVARRSRSGASAASRREHHSTMSVTSRIAGSIGKHHSFWAMYSFRMSVWIVPPSCSRRDALLLGGADVEGEQDRRRRVDRHRGRDLVERDPGEQVDHVVEGVDRDALDARPRRASARGRSRAPSASACRTRSRARSGRGRAGSGSARWSRRRCRSRRTGASSRAGRGTSTGRRRACRGTRRGSRGRARRPSRPGRPRV